MTDSNEEGIERHRQMLTVWQRTQLSHKQRPKNARCQENVRTWERECESEQEGVYMEPLLPFGEGCCSPSSDIVPPGLLCLAYVPRTPCPYSWAGPGPGLRALCGEQRTKGRQQADLAAANQESRQGSI